MAAPATHIVLAEKLFEKYFSDKDKTSYVVGTSFPDIRYLGVIDRKKTHYHNVKISEIIKENSFKAGVKLHSLVDEVRESFMKKQKLYSLFPESPLLTQGVKFFEDRVLYDRGSDWKTLLSCFDNVLPQELEYGITTKDVQRWHSLLAKILSHKPGDEDVVFFVSEIGKPPQMAEEIIKIVNGVKKKESAEKIINEFYDNFETLFLDST